MAFFVDCFTEYAEWKSAFLQNIWFYVFEQTSAVHTRNMQYGHIPPRTRNEIEHIRHVWRMKVWVYTFEKYEYLCKFETKIENI